MAVSAADVIKVAKAEVGTHEKFSGGHWVNDSKYNEWFGKIPGYDQNGYGYPWCAVFVAWCADHSGAASLYPKSAGCETDVAWFKRAGRFSEYPAVGAQVFFGPGGGSHTGLVVAFDADTITTVEGNTNTNGSAEGDGVYLKTRQRRDSYVYGYGYPKFADGIVSADPAFAKEAPKTPVVTKPAPSKPSAPAKPAKPVVSVAHLNAARSRDIPAATGHTTYPAEVKVVEAALKAEGFLSAAYASDGSWGTMTDKAYNRFRREVLHLTGDDATGAVGLWSLQQLAARHGFTAKA
ncbi:CHAP domain-containing protein [Streptomyces sp. NPDC058960]|uniref:CHAP domain-containing protein n=1 Tax=Streptomyces sp. NPDC058960 TaxID=3346679 RepID=UPI0036BB100F